MDVIVLHQHNLNLSNVLLGNYKQIVDNRFQHINFVPITANTDFTSIRRTPGIIQMERIELEKRLLP